MKKVFISGILLAVVLSMGSCANRKLGCPATAKISSHSKTIS